MLSKSILETETGYSKQVLVSGPTQVELIRALRAKLLESILVIPDEHKLRLDHPKNQELINSLNLSLIYEVRNYPKRLFDNFEQISFSITTQKLSAELIRSLNSAANEPYVLGLEFKNGFNLGMQEVLDYLSKLLQTWRVAFVLHNCTVIKIAHRAADIRDELKSLRVVVNNPVLTDTCSRFISYLIECIITGDDVLFDEATFVFLKKLYVNNHYKYFPNIQLPPNSHEEKLNPRIGFEAFITKEDIAYKNYLGEELDSETFKIVSLLLEYHFIRISRLPNNC